MIMIMIMIIIVVANEPTQFKPREKVNHNKQHIDHKNRVPVCNVLIDFKKKNEHRVLITFML